jgi:hypothetical protein
MLGYARPTHIYSLERCLLQYHREDALTHVSKPNVSYLVAFSRSVSTVQQGCIYTVGDLVEKTESDQFDTVVRRTLFT